MTANCFVHIICAKVRSHVHNDTGGGSARTGISRRFCWINTGFDGFGLFRGRQKRSVRFHGRYQSWNNSSLRLRYCALLTRFRGFEARTRRRRCVRKLRRCPFVDGQSSYVLITRPVPRELVLEYLSLRCFLLAV